MRSDNEFTWPVRVYYEDTDAGGVVYYANYLKFMERARSEWLRALGFEQDQLVRDHRVIFAVRHVSIDYLKPAMFNDHLQVQVKLLKRGGATLHMAHSIANQRGDELVRGAVKVACLDSESFRPRPIPEFIVTELLDASGFIDNPTDT
jgi:acyl-CoA thioester hydrolase